MIGRPRIHINLHDQYGRLKIIEETKGTSYSRRFYCRCVCKQIVIVNLNALLSGNTKSCGCLKRDKNKNKWTTHGQSKSKLYKVWHSMKQRCENSNDRSYPNYGGRGIVICKEWQDFKVFCLWATFSGYVEGLTIERINNDGNYHPDNCTWIQRALQSKNRRKFKDWKFKDKALTINQ